MKRSINILSLIICSVLLLSVLGGCGNPAARSKEDAVTVMTVGEYSVPRDMYDYFYNNYMAQYVGENETVSSDEDKALLENKVAEDTEYSLKKFYAVYSLAAEYGIDPESKDITDAKALAEEAFIVNSCNGSRDDLYAMLTESGMTYEVFLMLMEHSALENSLYDEMIYQNTIDTEALAGDGENPDFKENIARVKHVLIKPEPSYKNIISEASPQNEQARLTAEKVYSLAQNGTDFDSLINEYGDDMTMFANDVGAYIFMGNQDKAYESTAFALKPGQISEPVLTQEGWAVILRLDTELEYLRDNFSSLITSCTEGQFNILVEKRCEQLEAVKVQE